jgi:vacuolar-type H+-ATPase subunit E/Vma4
MSIESILQRIEEETDEAVKGVLGRAESEAAAIREDYEKRGARLREELGHRSRAKATEEERRLVVGEELELRKALLAKKREILSQVYREARSRIEKLPQGDYIELVKALILANSGSGTEEIVVPRDQRELFAGAFLESLNEAKGPAATFSIAEEPGDFSWGVVLRESWRRVDLTLEVIFDQLKTRIESEVASVLFSE